MNKTMKTSVFGALIIAICLLSGSAFAGPELSADWKDVTVNGSEVNVTILATNSGDEDASEVWFELFVRQGEAEEGETSVDTETKDPFAIGDYEFSMKTGALAPGTYTIELHIDTLENNEESNEDDNIISTEVTIEAAPKGYVDLEAVNLTASITDSNVQFTGIVRNNGTLASGPAVIDVFCGSVDAPLTGSHGYPFGTTSAIEPGQELSVEMKLVNKLEGTYPCWIAVDNAEAIAETDETNNLLGPIDITVPAYSLTPLADITILDVNPVINENGSIKYETTFYNASEQPMADFKCEIFYNEPTAPEFGATGDKGYDFLTSFGQVLQPGTTKLMTGWTWEEAPASGVFQAYVYCDTQNVYPEANENNNMYGPVVVDRTTPPGKPDLVVEDVTTEVDGYNVTYNVTIGNQGAGTPGSYDVDLFANAEETPSVVDGAVATAFTSVIGGPAPGQTLSVQVEFNSDSPGDFSSWIVIDAYQQVTEVDESNNDFGPTAITIEEAQKPELTITSFEGEVVAGNGNFSVTIENTGSEPAGAFDVSLYTGAFEGGEPTGDDEAEETVRVPELDSGASEIIGLTWENAPAGSNPAFVIIDPENEVDEANENNNVEGPVVISIDEANCANGTFLEAQCICGTEPQQTGYCCDGVWSALPCGINEVEDQEESAEEDATSSDEANGDETAGESGEEDEGEDIVAPDSDDEGCAHSTGAHLPMLLFVLLIMGFIIPRRNFIR